MNMRCTGHSPRREDDQQVKFTGMEFAASVLSGSRVRLRPVTIAGFSRVAWSGASTRGSCKQPLASHCPAYFVEVSCCSVPAAAKFHASASLASSGDCSASLAACAQHPQVAP